VKKQLVILVYKYIELCFSQKSCYVIDKISFCSKFEKGKFLRKDTMGCMNSNHANPGTRDPRGGITRAPVLLFYIPEHTERKWHPKFWSMD
jgi:hypothetical protein